MRVTAVVQARLGSTRLPRKVLLDVAGAPMLIRCLRRLERAERVEGLVVATTTEPADDELAAFAERNGLTVFRGSEQDVLSRYVGAARAAGADAVVRITSDCPLIDPAVVDTVIARFLEGDADYASNVLPPRTYPRGLDTEVVRRAALELAAREATDPADREHVTRYLYTHPERFRLAAVRNDADLSALRWTVDTPEDLALARAVFAHFGHDRFGWADVLAALDEHPEWREINAHVAQKLV